MAVFLISPDAQGDGPPMTSVTSSIVVPSSWLDGDATAPELSLKLPLDKHSPL